MNHRYSVADLHRQWIPVADPGFSPGGAPTPKVGVLTNFFGRKLHENERIWTPRGGASLAPPLDPPLDTPSPTQLSLSSCSFRGNLAE